MSSSAVARSCRIDSAAAVGQGPRWALESNHTCSYAIREAVRAVGGAERALSRKEGRWDRLATFFDEPEVRVGAEWAAPAPPEERAARR